MPHSGADGLAAVAAEGYRLQHPLRRVGAGGGGRRAASGRVGRPPRRGRRGGEGGRGRLGRPGRAGLRGPGSRTTATLTFRGDVGEVAVVDLLEDERDDLPPVPMAVDGTRVTITLTPFQIATLRFRA